MMHSQKYRKTERGAIFSKENDAKGQASILNLGDDYASWAVGRRDNGFAVYRTVDGKIWQGV